ncbi:restriction endonuclease subunit S [Flavobacterium sp. CFS9]|uniref:Restriction endonuclease subunit S n=1 Tax=Flavobacterium sp. CFS9 TaxID=3143118 RepID=A0AAT9H3B7_9FLAO
MKVLNIKKSIFGSNAYRLDAKPYLSSGNIVLSKLQKSKYELTNISYFAEDIFYGGRDKRYYVNNVINGIPFMGISDMLKNNLFSLKLISKKLTRNLENYLLDTGWILISRSGTIGNTIYSNEFHKGKAASEHIIRIKPKKNVYSGYLYAYLSSKYGYNLLTKGTFGAVIQHIEPDFVKDIPIPLFPETEQQKIHGLIMEAADLRVEANKLLKGANKYLYDLLNLEELTNDDYEYFGNHVANREVSTYSISIKEINANTINAFNYSRRIKRITNIITSKSYLNLKDCLLDNGYFSTGSFKRLEVNSDNGIKLLNQSDIFNSIKVGKNLSKRAVGNVKLVEYGEVLIAGVGTLGEGETFCRTIFANEELEKQLVSGEFIRLKTNESVPSGYLYCWLASDYGFRLIRSTQSGTKLCRPIPNLLKEIPVPVLESDQMLKIDTEIKTAYTNLYLATTKENQAIDLIEKEIDAWQ